MFGIESRSLKKQVALYLVVCGAFQIALLPCTASGFDQTQTVEIRCLRAGEPETVLQGGSGDWRFAESAEAALGHGDGGAARHAAIEEDGRTLRLVEVRHVPAADGNSGRDEPVSLGVVRLLDDGLSVYAEWLPAVDAPVLKDAGPLVVRDLRTGTQVHLVLGCSPPAESIVFLVDASGSMRGEKLDRAKAALLSTLNRLGGDSEVALFVFFDCDDIKLVLPFGRVDARSDETRKVVSSIEARQGTPLGDAMSQAFDYLHRRAANPPDHRRLVVLSDGMQTCGVDPTAVANGWDAVLKQKQELVVIGLEADSRDEAVLKSIAAAGDGTFLQVSRTGLDRALQSAARKRMKLRGGE